MIGTALGVGTVLKTEMVVHHVATLALISLSYRINLLRYGTMWMALFDLRWVWGWASYGCGGMKLKFRFIIDVV